MASHARSRNIVEKTQSMQTIIRTGGRFALPSQASDLLKTVTLAIIYRG
jgi:hypothetical protein